jgi:hypothetical protein
MQLPIQTSTLVALTTWQYIVAVNYDNPTFLKFALLYALSKTFSRLRQTLSRQPFGREVPCVWRDPHVLAIRFIVCTFHSVIPTFMLSTTTTSMNNFSTDIGTTSEMFWTEYIRVNRIYRFVIIVPSPLRSDVYPRGYKINHISTLL